MKPSFGYHDTLISIMTYSDDNWGQFVNIDEDYDPAELYVLEEIREPKIHGKYHKFNSYLQKIQVINWSKAIRFMVYCIIILTGIKICI